MKWSRRCPQVQLEMLPNIDGPKRDGPYNMMRALEVLLIGKNDGKM